MFSAVRQVAHARVSHPLRVTRHSVLVPRVLAYRTIVTKKFTKDHEFVSFDDAIGVGTIGVTHYAQKSLGDVVFVDLPTVGSKFSQGDAIGTVESVKAASDIVYYAPVSGEIVEINEQLNAQPGLVNRSPDDEGWLCKIKLSDTKELDELLTPEAYAETHEP